MTRQKRNVQYLAALCASLAYMFTGATLSWPSPALPRFKNGEARMNLSDTQLSWLVSLSTVGGLPGCFIAQVAGEKFGRRHTIFASSAPGFLGSSMIMFTTTPELLYVARLLQGISTGMVAVVAMIYITEIADKEIRGVLGMVVQVMMNIGGLLMYGIGPFVSYTTLNSIVLAIPAIYLAACLWIPESPYYHLKDGRIDAAKKTFMYIKGTKDEKWSDEQLAIMRAHVRESMENKSTLKELLTNVRYRKAVNVIAGLKALQYMTGSLAIQSYLEMIFRQSSSISGPHASIVYGFVQLGAGTAATFLTGHFGRRILMLTSSLGVAISLTIVGIYFFLQDMIQVSPETLSSVASLPLIGILGFNILYSIGIGNLPYVMQAELFPINVKSVASSAATMAACVFSFTVAKGYQAVKDSCGHYTVFWIFAAFAYAGVFFVYFLVPETKGKTLEEVQDNLRVNTREESRRLRDKVEDVVE